MEKNDKKIERFFIKDFKNYINNGMYKKYFYTNYKSKSNILYNLIFTDLNVLTNPNKILLSQKSSSEITRKQVQCLIINKVNYIEIEREEPYDIIKFIYEEIGNSVGNQSCIVYAKK